MDYFTIEPFTFLLRYTWLEYDEQPDVTLIKFRQLNFNYLNA